MSTSKTGLGSPEAGAGETSGKRRFTDDELAAASEGPAGDPELDEVDAANIDDDEAADPETSFEKLVSKSRKLSPERVRSVLQSVLFVAPAPLNVGQLHEATGIEQEQIEQAMNALGGTMRDGITGIVLHEVAGGWQLRTDPGSGEYVRRFLRVKPQRLTRAAVETLAIIAYRQPVTRPEIEDIRGVDCAALMKALLDRKLIKILGKKEEVGRPILYGTTREFLEFFALKDLSSLPTLREFQELTREHQEIVEKEAPGPGVDGTVAALADPEFEKRLEASNQESEAALEALESAMTTAEHRSKTVAEVLNPPAPAAPPPGEINSAGVNDSGT